MDRLEAAQWLREAKGNREALETAVEILEDHAVEPCIIESVMGDKTVLCPNCGDEVPFDKNRVHYCRLCGVKYIYK